MNKKYRYRILPQILIYFVTVGTFIFSILSFINEKNNIGFVFLAVSIIFLLGCYKLSTVFIITDSGLVRKTILLKKEIKWGDIKSIDKSMINSGEGYQRRILIITQGNRRIKITDPLKDLTEFYSAIRDRIRA